jgi:hypothetical protein
LFYPFPTHRNEIKARKKLEMSEKYESFLRVEYNIWNNFHGEQLNWIATDLEVKFKNSSGFEFDLKSN